MPHPGQPRRRLLRRPVEYAPARIGKGVGYGLSRRHAEVPGVGCDRHLFRSDVHTRALLNCTCASMYRFATLHTILSASFECSGTRRRARVPQGRRARPRQREGARGAGHGAVHDRKGCRGEEGARPRSGAWPRHGTGALRSIRGMGRVKASYVHPAPGEVLRPLMRRWATDNPIACAARARTHGEKSGRGA